MNLSVTTTKCNDLLFDIIRLENELNKLKEEIKKCPTDEKIEILYKARIFLDLVDEKDRSANDVSSERQVISILF